MFFGDIYATPCGDFPRSLSPSGVSPHGRANAPYNAPQRSNVKLYAEHAKRDRGQINGLHCKPA